MVAAVSSAAKAEFLYGLGADEVVTYDQESWGEPVDIVLDGVGGELLPRALGALASGGRLIFFNSGGGTVPAFELLAGSKTITGLTMRRFAAVHRELYRAAPGPAVGAGRSGRVRAAVHAELPLADAAKAHEIIEARANLGKVVLGRDAIVTDGPVRRTRPLRSVRRTRHDRLAPAHPAHPCGPGE